MELNASERITQLRATLTEASRKYHVLCEPTGLTDEDYDLALRELSDLEAANPSLAADDSPTRKIGFARSSSFAPYPHAKPMLSLANAFNEAEVRAFDERVRALSGFVGPIPCLRAQDRRHFHVRPI